jgi:O-methyltransferase
VVASVGATLYLELMKRCLTRSIFPTYSHAIGKMPPEVEEWLEVTGYTVVAHDLYDPLAREHGMDWPSDAETMVGMLRLESLQHCVVDVLEQGVPGDLIETGVWRGGASILMRAVLAAYGDTQRRVWVADSFEGLPVVERGPGKELAGDTLSEYTNLAISLDTVKANFERYGLLDDQVCFLKGWFCDTLPTAPLGRLAIARLDGDLYESTMDALSVLYPKLSVGGYLIVDDLSIGQCRDAVDDYRKARGIDEPIVSIDWTGGYWKKAWPAPA